MEDDEIDERSHARLTAAISKLDRTQHIRTPARGEPTALTGEFDLVKSSRIDVGGVVNVLENSAKLVQIGKTIKKTQVREKILPKPQEKPQAERIKRSSTFESTRKKLGRWDAVVARSRTVDFVSFPLKTAVNKLTPTKDYLSKLELKSDLERELDQVEGRTEDLIEEDEEEKFPMTYEEMLEQRREMAKLRAQQSFKAAKAKRQSKIKSKKYHRILKKERMKQQLKDFEELQKSDPEEALRRLESLEKSRAVERHTLRHKNTGKWAKSKLVRAKYNPEVRQQLAEQLSVSRNLTQKVLQSSDDESEKEEGIPDLPVTHDPLNPWMTNSKKSTEEENFDFGYKKYVKEKFSKDSSSDDDENDNNAETSINDDENYDSEPNHVEGENVQNPDGNESDDSIEYKNNNGKIDNESNAESDNNVNEGSNSDKTEFISIENITLSKKSKTTVSTTEWAVEIVESTIPVEKPMKKNKKQVDVTHAFDTLDSELDKKVREKIHKLREDIEKINTNPGPYKKRKWGDDKEDNLSKLGFKNKKIRPIIDSELNETTDKDPITSTASTETSKSLKDIANSAVSIAAGNSESITADVDPTRFIAAKPKYLATALSVGNDGLNNIDDEQVVPKVNIEDVFEEDDVVASFRQEKEDEINKDKVTNVDLRLPGWGSWGGKGVKAPKRKRSRFIFKAPPKLPRRDENKGDIIIKEFKDPKLAVHKVTELPFPFTSLKDFEASIRAPLGNTFIPEIAHRKVIKPSVFTKAGTIIEPMDDDELMIPRNQSFKNKNIIKLIGNK